MLAPIGRTGAPSTWNGPKTVFSVAPSGRRLLIASTSMEKPSVSLRRMNSCRSPEQIWPVLVRKSMPTSHSSCVSCTSFAKAWRCFTSAAMTAARRGLMFGPMRALTASTEPSSVK